LIVKVQKSESFVSLILGLNQKEGKMMKKIFMVTLIGLAALSIMVFPCSAADIHGCYKKNNGQLRIVENANECGQSEISIQWNDEGVQGPAGPQGEQGPQGVQGVQGLAGTDGLSCWDLNSSGECEPATEDVNQDGTCDALDCQGPTAGTDTATLETLIYGVCTIAQSTGAPKPPGLCHKTVFVSSLRYSANLGGLSGADSKCQTLAHAAGLLGSYRAWLSSASTSASSRLTHSDVPYMTVGRQTIADNWTDLTDGILQAPVTDEVGVIHSDDVWTGTTTNGDARCFYSWDCCQNWTTTEDLISYWDPYFSQTIYKYTSAWVGNSGYYNDPRWTQQPIRTSCTPENEARLYCIQQ
jgi:hypothetical protein